jgi:DNA-binding winged helix-turn-helix (wHTH) protein
MTFSASWPRPRAHSSAKDELMARVWGGVVVEENNLQVHISALRKAFEEEKTGERWINTGPARGYLLRPTAPFQRSACHRYWANRCSGVLNQLI